MHPLYTVFQRLALADELTIQPAEGEQDQLIVRGDADVPEDSSNLVLQALRVLRETGVEPPPLNIELTKTIPTGSGLGGGSSDAAAVFRYLDREGLLPEGVLREEALEVGADVPFFLNGSSAVGRGYGEKLTSIPPLEAYVVLANPDWSVSTEVAYRALEPLTGDQDRLPDPEEGDPHRWEDWDLTNDFQEVVRNYHEGFEPIFRSMENVSEHTSLTGSGSVIYSLFKYEEARDQALRHLANKHPEVDWIPTSFI